MASEFKGRRAATEEARKILRQQVDKGLSSLTSRRPSGLAIHRARKQIKMARATLRLIRPGLSNKQYRAENVRLRDAAKPLSAARDAAVLREAFQRIQTHLRGGRDGAAEVERMLVNEQLKAHRQVTDGPGVPRSRRLLREARALTFSWHLDQDGWSTIGKGVRRVYRQGRRALQALHAARSDAGFHQWRKQVKYLRYQLELLRPIWPAGLAALARQLHTLSDRLGDDHDLVILRSRLTAYPGLLSKLDHERAVLQHQALAAGARLYKASPTQFCSKLRRYWRVW